MRPSLNQVVLAALVLSGCAHAREERAVTFVVPSTEAAVAAPSDAPPELEAPAPRPRLSRTITLGQGAEPTYIPPRPPSEATAPAQSVVVNNQIVVHAPPIYGFGYGYGAAYGGYARPTAPRDARSAGAHGPAQWGRSGWEGARATAAPGQTPGVGGNWAPPPSYGPATMR